MRAVALILLLAIVGAALLALGPAWLPRDTLVVLAGCGVGVGAAWFAGMTLWLRMPLREVGIKALALRSLLGALLFTIVTALLVAFTGGEPFWLALLVGMVVAVGILSTASVLWYAPIRETWVLREALTDEARRVAVADDMVASFGPPDPGATRIEKTRRVLRAVTSARVLSDVQLWSHALEIVDKLDLDGVAVVYRAAAQSWRAVLRLYVGDRPGAYACLTDALRLTVEPSITRGLRLTMALSTALDGRGQEALTQLAAIDEPREPRLRRSHQLARIEAHAAAGDRVAAEQILAQLGEHQADIRARLKALGGAGAAL